MTLRREVRCTVAVAALVAGAACGAESPALPDTLEGIQLDTLFTIGQEAGAAHEVFEGIWDIEVDASGRLAVLDIGPPAVHVYDASGAHIGSIDEHGLEDGQIDRPSSIVWAGPGALAVWDPGSSWVSHFDVGREGVAFEERWRAFAFGETGFCARDGRAFLSYYQDGAVVHEVGPMGVVGSFGAAPEVAGANALGPELLDIAVEELTPSALLCTDDGVLDVSFVQASARLSGYDGAEVWSAALPGLRPIVVYSDDTVGLGRAFDAEQGSHLLRSVVRWGPDRVLIQHEIRREEFPEPGAPEVIESRLVDLSDGSEVGRTRTLPLILATSGARLYLAEREPFARLTIVEAR